MGERHLGHRVAVQASLTLRNAGARGSPGSRVPTHQPTQESRPMNGRGTFHKKAHAASIAISPTARQPTALA